MARRRTRVRWWPAIAVVVAAAVPGCSGGGDEQAVGTGWEPAPPLASGVDGVLAQEPTSSPASTTIATPVTSSTPTTTTSAAMRTTTTISAEPSGALPIDPNLIAAAEYLGVTPGVPAATSDPIVIGVVDQIGGVAAFGDSTFGIDAAISMLNTSLGGLQGHPIEVRRCTIRGAADGARCALELVGDPAVRVVVIGTILDGEAALLEGIAATRPVVIANPLTLRQYAAHAVAFTPGLPSVYRGSAVAAFDAGSEVAGSPKAVTVAVVATGNAPSLNAVGALAEPALRQLGAVGVERTTLPAGAGAAELDLLLAATDLSRASSLLIVGEPAACAALHRTLLAAATAGLPWGELPVVATQSCLGQALTDHLASLGSTAILPEGWMIGGFTGDFSPLAADQQQATEAALATYADLIAEPAPPASADVDVAFGAVMTMARIVDDLDGRNNLDDVAVVRAALAGASHAAWGIDGRLDCGSQPPFVVLCGSQIRIDQVVDGRLVPSDVGNRGIVNPARRLPA